MNYEKANQVSNKYGERNDCTVKATAIAIGTSYEDSHTLLKKFGRKDYRGCKTNQVVIPALESRGFECIEIKELYKFNLTLNKFERSNFVTESEYPLLVRVNRHLLCIKDRKNEDFTKGNRQKVLQAWYIKPTENSISSENIDTITLSEKIVRKQSTKKYVLRHTETKHVYKTYKRKPTSVINSLKYYPEGIWIKGKMTETRNKLEVVQIT